MTDDTCPACGEPIEEFDRVDETSYELHPCGHQIDDELYEELSEKTDENFVARRHS